MASPLRSTPTPNDGLSAANSSPVEQPSSRTRAPSGIKNFRKCISSLWKNAARCRHLARSAALASACRRDFFLMHGRRGRLNCVTHLPCLGSGPCCHRNRVVAGHVDHTRPPIATSALYGPQGAHRPQSATAAMAAAELAAISTMKREFASAKAVCCSRSSAATNVPPHKPAAAPAAKSCALSPTIQERAKSDSCHERPPKACRDWACARGDCRLAMDAAVTVIGARQHRIEVCPGRRQVGGHFGLHCIEAIPIVKTARRFRTDLSPPRQAP